MENRPKTGRNAELKPCLNCAERYIGCHGRNEDGSYRCGKYAEVEAARAEERVKLAAYRREKEIRPLPAAQDQRVQRKGRKGPAVRKGTVSMAEGKSKKDDFLWWVQCEGHYDVPVIAPNWELATVEAAHLWGVPWAKVAARCELREKLPVVRNVCQRCGKIFHGSGPLCDDCISIIRIEEQRKAAARKDYFRRLYAGH